MREEPKDHGVKRQQALRDRYPPDGNDQNRGVQEDLQALRQGLRDLSEVVSGLTATLRGTTRRVDVIDPRQEATIEDRLRLLQEEAEAIRAGLVELRT